MSSRISTSTASAMREIVGRAERLAAEVGEGGAGDAVAEWRGRVTARPWTVSVSGWPGPRASLRPGGVERGAWPPGPRGVW